MHNRLVSVVILITYFYGFRILVTGISGDEVLYKENMKRCLAFKCGQPQPRIVRYQEVLKDHYTLEPCERINNPTVTVLHICDFEAGYCGPKFSCKPKETEEVTIVFQISLEWTSGGCKKIDKQAKYVKYVNATVSNHTLCSCQEDHNLIK